MSATADQLSRFAPSSNPDLSLRLLDSTDACRASQKTLQETMGRIEGHLSKISTAAQGISWVLSSKGIVTITILVALPTLLVLLVLLVLLGQGPALLNLISVARSAI